MPSFTRRETLQSLAFALSAMVPFRGMSAQPPIPGGGWTGLDLATNRYLTLPVRVNGRAMQGVIDSGTTQSIIRHDIALDMGLPYLGTAWAETFTNQMSGSLYRVDTFELSGVQLRNVPMGAFDTSQISPRLHQDLPIILGQDILRSIDIEADLVGNRIRSLSPKNAAGMAGSQAAPALWD
ncbi:MAG TPA: retropepsin-like aspartic protease [Sphingobium sp.]|uniref:retropepsin-like aspartic protease n=1 Tax=Sphingobium sp. TaxID=1912891 RepID=UPI002ED3ED21